MPDKWVGLPVCVESMQGILADRKTKTRRVGLPGPYPYGPPGQGVYFREPVVVHTGRKLRYAADAEWQCIPKECQEWYGRMVVKGLRTTPGRSVPRRLARACATISEVRFEKLVDISEADAIAEGCQHCCNGENCNCHGEAAICEYIAWWNRLNEKKGFGWGAALDGKWHGWVSVTSWTDVVIGWEEVQEMLG